jgi:hypothetical protein
MQAKTSMMGESSPTGVRFSVEVELANLYDIFSFKQGRITSEDVRRIKLRAIVGTQASRLVISDRIAKELGLDLSDTTLVHYSDGRRIERPLAEHLCLTFEGRNSYFGAVVEPELESVLIGQLALWDLDVEADFANRRLKPRDPDNIVVELGY